MTAVSFGTTCFVALFYGRGSCPIMYGGGSSTAHKTVAREGGTAHTKSDTLKHFWRLVAVTCLLTYVTILKGNNINSNYCAGTELSGAKEGPD